MARRAASCCHRGRVKLHWATYQTKHEDAIFKPNSGLCLCNNLWSVTGPSSLSGVCFPPCKHIYARPTFQTHQAHEERKWETHRLCGSFTKTVFAKKLNLQSKIYVFTTPVTFTKTVQVVARMSDKTTHQQNQIFNKSVEIWTGRLLYSSQLLVRCGNQRKVLQEFSQEAGKLLKTMPQRKALNPEPC